MSDREQTGPNPTGGVGSNNTPVTSARSAISLIEEGNALEEQGRPGEAMERYEAAVRADPRCARAHLNRGNILLASARTDEARNAYQRALACDPHYAGAYFNLANLHSLAGEYEEAVRHYEAAIRIKPDFADAFVALGNALADLGSTAEAMTSYQRALAIKPNYAEVHFNLGLVAQKLNRHHDALQSYERALRIAPDCDWVYGNWLLAKMQLCDWSNLDSQITTLIAGVKHNKKITASFPVLALTDSLSVQRQAVLIWVNEKHPPIHSLGPIKKRRRSEKIRIGYYSADYHDHATACLAAGLFERHDRKKFEVVAFSYGPDKRDDMRKRLVAAFDRFVDVRTKSDSEVARLSRELEIDIALDLKGFTQDARAGILSFRAAPIQVNYLGYPGTMGAPWIDYIVADRVLIPPESRQHYAERVVYLPNSYQVNDRKRKIADRVFSRAELGLPPNGFVFCCFNNSYKITPDTFAVWMRLLKRIEGSVLWLLEDSELAANNLRREAQAREVDAARLIFAPRMPLPEHLARQRAADLFLDTLPCNAHTTASDALWAGVPVLTCIGESFAARVAASLLNAVGLPELITATQDHYEAVAIELSGDPARLAEIREALHRNRLTMPLFDTELFAKQLEDAYTQMFERYQSDLSPDHIYALG